MKGMKKSIVGAGVPATKNVEVPQFIVKVVNIPVVAKRQIPMVQT